MYFIGSGNELLERAAGCHAGNRFKSIVSGGIDRDTLGVHAFCHNLRHIGIIEVPPLAGKGNEACICAVFLEPLRPLRGGELLCPILQICRHSGRIGRLPEADGIRTQLMHGGGHIILRPSFIFLVRRTIQAVPVQLIRVALGEGHIHGQPCLMVGRFAGNEPVLAIAHCAGILHIFGYSGIAVDQAVEAVPHSGLCRCGPERLVDD